MMAAKKVKVSLTISSDLLARVDRAAKREGTTRSYLVEQWLDAGASRAAERAIDLATVAYYTSRTPEERAEEEALGEASSRHAREIDYDVAQRRRRRTRRR